MVTVEFQYKGDITYIQSKFEDILNDVCSKFIQKANIDLNNIEISYLYSGKTLDLSLTINQIINNLDRERKIIRILVFDDKKNFENQNSLIKSSFIICPTCNEHARFEINNYKIKIYNCKNGHVIDNILLTDFEKTQLIDESKIVCDNCKIKNKFDSYNKEMYICNICKMNLCPLCKQKHDKKHKIIKYEDKYYICDKHNKEYYSYCHSCKQDLCVLCSKNHEFHPIIPYNKAIPENIDFDILKCDIDLIFNSFKTKIMMIIDRLNNLIKNYEIYFNMIKNNLDNYDVNCLNYNICDNINYIANSLQGKVLNNKLNNDLMSLLKEKNYNNFIPKILNIYNEVNKNEIDLIYNITKDHDIIKIFGENFVENNKDLCKIIHENTQYDLNEYFECVNYNSDTLKIKLKGINNVSNLESMFEECSELSCLSDFSNFDTTYAINMRYLFSGCEFEQLPDISKFNTSNVINMDEMFSSCALLKTLPDISNWNTSKVAQMGGMFKDCLCLTSLPDISKWDITYAIKMKKTSDMFLNCPESLNIPEKFKVFKEKNLVKINYY